MRLGNFEGVSRMLLESDFPRLFELRVSNFGHSSQTSPFSANLTRNEDRYNNIFSKLIHRTPLCIKEKVLPEFEGVDARHGYWLLKLGFGGEEKRGKYVKGFSNLKDRDYQ